MSLEIESDISRADAYHAVGATPDSADGAAMLRRLLAEFRRRLGVGEEIPAHPVQLCQAFIQGLYLAAARGKVVLVVDGLNHLEDRDGMPDLLWLPPVLPANVRLIVSTLPGRSLDELVKRRWPTLPVLPLERDERRRVIVEVLRHASKVLDTDWIEQIATASQASNPLFLRALLEELRVFGVHEKLDEQIRYYLGATDLNALFTRILQRYEEDYERDRPGLVGEAMTLLWAARRGLSEEELRCLLGNDQVGQPLPHAYWSPLYLAAEHALLNTRGLIGFFHDYMRRAVENRYLPGLEEKRAAHRRLASFFAVREQSRRTVEELPWQLVRCERWEELYSLMTDLKFIAESCRTDRTEVQGYWVQIEMHTPHRIESTYRSVLENPTDHSECLDSVGCLLIETTICWDEALKLCQCSMHSSEIYLQPATRTTKKRFHLFSC